VQGNEGILTHPQRPFNGLEGMEAMRLGYWLLVCAADCDGDVE
jgi:hypothetical protein